MQKHERGDVEIYLKKITKAMTLNYTDFRGKRQPPKGIL